jgi:glycosyltransferase involved in cell wall biosynthesis
MNIGIVITTFKRDWLLQQTIDSCLKLSEKNNNIHIIVVDQCPTIEKRNLVEMFGSYVLANFNSGLSLSRNLGVKKSTELGCKYTIIAADSISLSNNYDELDQIIKKMEIDKYDLVGFPLENRVKWEGNLSLIPSVSFQIDFIQHQRTGDLIIQPCDICRNFFVARTELLQRISWDENLLMAEHEDMFYRLKQANTKVGFTNKFSGIYIGIKDGEYLSYRTTNFKNGLKKLKEKYQINGWVKYKNLQYAKEP